MLAMALETRFDAAALEDRCRKTFTDAAGQLGDAVVHDSESYVPYNTGQLCRSVSRGTVTEDDGRIGSSVVWQTPYAAAVYYGDRRGVRFRTEHHPRAQARWLEGARSAAQENWCAAVRRCVQAEF